MLNWISFDERMRQFFLKNSRNLLESGFKWGEKNVFSNTCNWWISQNLENWTTVVVYSTLFENKQEGSICSWMRCRKGVPLVVSRTLEMNTEIQRMTETPCLKCSSTEHNIKHTQHNNFLIMGWDVCVWGGGGGGGGSGIFPPRQSFFPGIYRRHQCTCMPCNRQPAESAQIVFRLWCLII